MVSQLPKHSSVYRSPSLRSRKGGTPKSWHKKSGRTALECSSRTIGIRVRRKQPALGWVHSLRQLTAPPRSDAWWRCEHERRAQTRRKDRRCDLGKRLSCNLRRPAYSRLQLETNTDLEMSCETPGSRQSRDDDCLSRGQETGLLRLRDLFHFP